MAVSLRHKLSIILLAVYWPTFFIASHIPVPGLVREAGVSDKALHFLAYLTLAFLFWATFSPECKVNWRKVCRFKPRARAASHCYLMPKAAFRLVCRSAAITRATC